MNVVSINLILQLIKQMVFMELKLDIKIYVIKYGNSYVVNNKLNVQNNSDNI